MTREPLPDETAPHGLGEGIALVHRAQDGGEWRPVVDWLARNPALAESLARFVGGERRVAAELAPAPPAVRTGTVLGDFELREELGRGKMGEVYRAQDLRIARTVAVKVLNTCGAMAPDELVRSRFEAEAMAALSHPNVVPVYEYGEVGGVPYLVMPLMPGGTLAGWLKALGPDRLLDPMRAAEIVRDVALGVHHAHQHQLIHRDLKPANILLDRDDNPRVADFGLARRADATVTSVAGSPAYMAPEQARGERHLTTAVDIHALGAILFELLTGRPPFGGADVASVLRHVAEEPAPAVRTVRPDVPRDLEAVCAKCLEKNPRHRYTSAQELAEDLGRFLEGSGTIARLPGLWGKAVRTVLRQQFNEPAVWGRLALSTGIVTAATSAFTAWAIFARLPTESFVITFIVSNVVVVVMYWLFLHRHSFRSGDRHTLTVMIGSLVATMFVPVVYRPPEGGDLTAYRLSLFPLISLISALYWLSLAAPFWGGYYLIGVGYFAMAVVFKFVPVLGPVLYALIHSGFIILTGLYLIRVGGRCEPSHQGRAAVDGAQTVTAIQSPDSVSGSVHPESLEAE